MSLVKRWIPVLLLLSATVLLVLSVIRGEAEVYLFILFPVFSGHGLLFVLSILLFIVGFLSVPLIFTEDTPVSTGFFDGEEAKIRSGGVIFVGPIPIIVLGDGRTAFYTLLALSALLIALFIIFF